MIERWFVLVRSSQVDGNALKVKFAEARLNLFWAWSGQALSDRFPLKSNIIEKDV